jgi:trans-2,3-dihydro-3-hydroxyanthranilate isomerase
MTLDFETCDVFTTTRFGGNPLAVVHRAAGLDGAAMQTLAREFNLSETVFVLEADAAAAAARIRIFTPAIELPFAGHPNVGAAVLLARRLGIAGERLALDQPAGRVAARLVRDAAGEVTAAEITAPRAYEAGAALDPAGIAACGGLPGLAGVPRLASCGAPFAVAEVADVAVLAGAAPDAASFRAHLPAARAVGLLLAAPLAPGRWRVRMFAPLNGIAEDPATGAAACAFGGWLLDRAGGDALSVELEQGIEMGRPSLLHVTARRAAEGIRVSVGGGVVPVARGTICT